MRQGGDGFRVHLGPPRGHIGDASLTIGSFDGVHLGHQALLKELQNVANGPRRTLITFEPHPRCVLDPANCPQSITTLDEKLELVERFGIDDAVVLAFTRELASLSAGEFMDQVESVMRLRHLVVGYDFALGRQRQGDIAWLRTRGSESGFEVIVVPPVTLGTRQLHSSEVRRLVTLGDVEQANELLGREFSLSGVVEAGERIGRRLGYPTINVAVEPNKLIPGHGIYAGRVTTPVGEFLGALSVGYQPQFDGTRLKVEAYLLEFSGDLYQQRVTVSFARRLRDEARFASVEELVAQMARDVDDTRRVLGGN